MRVDVGRLSSSDDIDRDVEHDFDTEVRVKSIVTRKQIQRKICAIQCIRSASVSTMRIVTTYNVSRSTER